jgi:hypothetical protein
MGLWPRIPPLGAVALTLGLTGSWLAAGSNAQAVQAGGSTRLTENTFTANDVFNGVSCPSTALCTVVGANQVITADTADPIAARWNGISWSPESVPVPPGVAQASLVAVSCPSSSSCTALGVSHTSQQARPRAFAERWNGSAWSLQALPAPQGAIATNLLSLSCPSANRCQAVGYFERSGGHARVLAERWNGIRWSIEPVGHGPANGAPAGLLDSVSCPTPRYCMAIGEMGTRGVALWNGTRWSVQPATPTTPVGADYVSCPSPDRCTTIGYLQSTVRAHRWNGKRWFLHSIGYFYNPRPGGLSCPTRTNCMSAGAYQDSSDTEGTWTEQLTAAGWHSAGGASDDAEDSPQAVSCSSPGACLVVGSWSFFGVAGRTSGPMAWFWNGTGWSDVSPVPPAH